MIQASHPTTLWYPGKKLEGFGAAQLSARAREIAKSREELLGLLQDVPESEFELSFTDLVERSDSSADSDAATCEERRELPAEEKDANRASGVGVKERKKQRRNSGGGLGRSSSSSNGVLLNMYMPSSLSRSLTASRASRGTTAGPKAAVPCEKREKQPLMFGCLSGLWERRREKSKKKVAERKRRESQDYCA